MEGWEGGAKNGIHVTYVSHAGWWICLCGMCISGVQVLCGGFGACDGVRAVGESCFGVARAANLMSPGGEQCEVPRFQL